MVTALDKNWHPECFCCVKCSRTFGDEGDENHTNFLQTRGYLDAMEKHFVHWVPALAFFENAGMTLLKQRFYKF